MQTSSVKLPSAKATEEAKAALRELSTLPDLIAYKQKEEAERQDVLDELTAEAEKHGLGY